MRAGLRFCIFWSQAAGATGKTVPTIKHPPMPLDVLQGPRAAWRLTGETIRPAQTGSNPVGGTGKRRRMNDTSNFKATGLSEQTLRSPLGAATTVAAGSVRKGHAFSGLQPLTVGEVGESFILNSLPVPASCCKMTRNLKTSSGCRNDPRRGQSGDPQKRLTREEAKIVKKRSP